MASLTRVLLGALAVGVVGAGLPLTSASAQQQGYGQTIEGATGSGGGTSLTPGTGKGGSALDAVNPIDLMNRIRRNQALDDATPPGDAVDQALRDFAAQSGSKPAGSGAAATVQAP